MKMQTRGVISFTRQNSRPLKANAFLPQQNDMSFRFHFSASRAGTSALRSVKSDHRQLSFFKLGDSEVKRRRVRVSHHGGRSLSKDIVAIDSPVGLLGPTVCYDLRFPELYQQLRFQHEAQVIAAARAGKHNDKTESYGDSLITDPWGRVVGRLPDLLSTGIAVADIDFSLIDSVRAKMPIARVCYNLNL